MKIRFSFTKGQLEKLSELSIDIAKGLLLASIAAPAISNFVDLAISLKSGLLGLTFVYLTLKIEEVKESL